MLHLNKSIRKVFAGIQVKVIDEEQMIIDHCISDDLPDRVNDDIVLNGWELDNFNANPVVLEAHAYDLPPVGKSLKVYTQGNQLRAETQFAPTDKGRLYFELYKGGFMTAFSVGFIALEYEAKPKNQGYHYTKVELLEYSVVPVPCNPRALKGVNIKYGVPISKANLEKLNAARESMIAAVGLIEEVIAEAEREDEETPEDQQDPETPPPDDGNEGDKAFDLLKGLTL